MMRYYKVRIDSYKNALVPEGYNLSKKEDGKVVTLVLLSDLVRFAIKHNLEDILARELKKK